MPPNSLLRLGRDIGASFRPRKNGWRPTGNQERCAPYISHHGRPRVSCYYAFARRTGEDSRTLGSRIPAFLGFACVVVLSGMMYSFCAYAPIAAKELPGPTIHDVLRIVAFHATALFGSKSDLRVRCLTRGTKLLMPARTDGVYGIRATSL